MGKVRFWISVVFAVSCILFVGYFIKTKMVEDNKSPVITCGEDAITVSVKDGQEALLKGVKAEDNRDGDLTDSVRVSSLSHFVNGKRTVKYAVFDKANNVGMYERTVTYSDYESPKIYVKEPLRIYTSMSSRIDFEGLYEAQDCLDGDITNQVRVLSENYYYDLQEGSIDVTLQVNNNAGDVRAIPVELRIIYHDNDEERKKEYPALSDYIVYTKVGKKIKPEKYLTGLMRGETEYKFDELGTVTKEDVKITSNVDYEKPGVYTVEFSYKAEGAGKAVTKLYVVVEES